MRSTHASAVNTSRSCFAKRENKSATPNEQRACVLCRDELVQRGCPAICQASKKTTIDTLSILTAHPTHPSTLSTPQPQCTCARASTAYDLELCPMRPLYHRMV